MRSVTAHTKQGALDNDEGERDKRIFHLTDTPPAPQPTISEEEATSLRYAAETVRAVASSLVLGSDVREYVEMRERELRAILARLTGGGK